MRKGDFSELLAQNILIYDPATAQQVGARVVRTPFPGNIIPSNRLSPIAQQLLKYFPEPNQAGTSGHNNYFSTNPRTDDLLLDFDTRRSSAHRQAAASSCATRGTTAASRATPTSAR